MIGSLLFFAAIATLEGSSSSLSGLSRTVLFGAGIGLVPALPVSAVVLPIAYAMLRHNGTPTPEKLAATGAIAGFIVSGGVLLALFSFLRPEDHLWLIVLGVAADGALAGAFCGMALGLIMRWMRPQGAPAP